MRYVYVGSISERNLQGHLEEIEVGKSSSVTEGKREEKNLQC